MHKKFLALALLTVMTMNAQREDTGDKPYHQGHREIAMAALGLGLGAGVDAYIQNKGCDEIVAMALELAAAGAIGSYLDMKTGRVEPLPDPVVKIVKGTVGTAAALMVIGIVKGALPAERN